ncbi:PHP domain-containing protein [Haloplanus pelagicus]|jgi:histidinol-phosphatase (PHP family)|uniref:PHP domain-containing protein n=1 Tax=Haloplanus pelagicus TaxID=2949995 RepID=UPI00203B2AFE|nr:PHP domain-containing protein [Haloplanus sp. HW8-1]
MRTDVHAHTTFSDGSELSTMIDAAEDTGLDALGLTDHCIVADDAFGRRTRYDLVETYERRREVIEAARERVDLTLYDSAEVSYVGSETDTTEAFLETAGFDYTIGSVHFAGEYDYTSDTPYVGESDGFRRAAVERYYDAVVSLVESDLFDVLGHLDLPERLETLRGHSRAEDYERVAAALADSRTVPELNAGRIDRALGRPHPDPSMFGPFADRDVGFVLGSDSHRPGELTDRVPALRDVTDDAAIELVGVDDLLA